MTLLKEEKEKMNQLMESKFNISRILGTDFLSAYRRAGGGGRRGGGGNSTLRDRNIDNQRGGIIQAETIVIL